MRPTSMGRKSSLNPIRVSTMNDKGSARTEVRRGPLRARGSSVGDNSQIPRPKIRNDSTDRANSRPSTLKVPGKPSTTPVATPRILSELGPTIRGRSPSAERASGLGTGGLGKNVKKDTRPLTDKSYQTSMLNRIDTFFRDAQQSSILNTNGSLKPVSFKIFVSASDFLLKLLDYKQELTLMNYMDELPKISKKLHYPGIMSKSWLKTANAPHSIAHVLAWLSWLVEICEIKDFANQTFQLKILPFVDGSDGEVINRSLFIALLELYRVWNDADLDKEIKLENNYINGIADKCGFTEEDMRKAANEITDAENKEHAILKNDDIVTEEFNIINEKLQLLITDENKQLAHLASQEKYLRDTEVGIERLINDTKMLDAESEKFNEQYVKLNELISNQVMSIEERDDIVKQCLEIQNYLNRFHEHVEEIQNEVWTIDLKLSNSRDQFERLILAFNRDIVINMGNDIGGDLEQLKLPETYSTSDIVDNLKLKSEIITNLKDKMKKDLNNCQGKIEKQNNRLEILHDKIKLLDAERNELAVKTNETKKCVRKLKEQAKKEEDRLQEVIQRMQVEIKQLQQWLPDTEAIQAELVEAQEKLEAVSRKKAYVEEASQRFFKKFFKTLKGFRGEIQKLIEKLPKNFEGREKNVYSVEMR